MADFELSWHDEDRFREGRNLYMGYGPDCLATDFPTARLRVAQDLLRTIDHPNAQETAGWAGIERLFHYPEDDDERAEVMERTRMAFGRAYDLYMEAGGYAFRRARLGLTAGSLALYEAWATNSEVSEDMRTDALRDWAASGRALLKAGGSVSESQRLQARTETAILISRLAVRGNTRKPIADLALPATLRQRIGHWPGKFEQKHGRYNSDVVLAKYNVREGAWAQHGGIRVMTTDEAAERVPLHKDILALPPEGLTRRYGSAAIDEALELFGEVFDVKESQKPEPEQRKAIVALATQLDRSIKGHDFGDFAAGTAGIKAYENRL